MAAAWAPGPKRADTVGRDSRVRQGAGVPGRLPLPQRLLRTEPISTVGADALERLGGRTLLADLWARLAGMAAERSLIERCVVLPLAEPELAAAHGVAPPRAIALFGPPGTGRTTFARAIASRLGWPLVELLPSRLTDGGNLAAAMREAFALLAELEQVVVFVVSCLALLNEHSDLLASMPVLGLGEEGAIALARAAGIRYRMYRFRPYGRRMAGPPAY